MFFKSIFALSLALNFYAKAAYPPSIKAESLLSSQATSFFTQFNDKKGLVVVFMSAKCPCSNSHVALLKGLAAKYKDFRFLAVHSNFDESKAEAQKYFKEAQLGFEVLQDNKTQIADLFKAYKTPHAFVLSPKGEVLYQGGVTNSSNAPSADQFFLKDALEDIAANRAVRVAEGRTLGCVIMRESDKHAW